MVKNCDECMRTQSSTNLEFDESIPAYLAVSACVPSVGSTIRYFKRYNARRDVWEYFDDSSEITEVNRVSNSIYKVRTINSLYFLQLIF